MSSKIFVSKMVFDINREFENVITPTFDELLEKIMYIRADDEPIILAKKHYPFVNLYADATYDYIEFFFCLSFMGLNLFVPKVMIGYLNEELDYNDNFIDTFLYCLNVKNRNNISQMPGYQNISKFCSNLLKDQSTVLQVGISYLEQKAS